MSTVTRDAEDDDDTQPPPAPFWHRLNTFFGFPLQLWPLLHAGVLAFCSLLVFPLGRAISLPLAGVVVVIGLLLAISRYGFKVMALGAQGMFRTADYPHRMEDGVTSLPWKLFLVLLAQGFAAGLVQRMFGEGAGLLATGVVSLVMPATTIVLLLSRSGLAALNPARLWDTMTVIGWPYLLLFFFLYLLNGGMGLGAVFVVTKIGRAVALPLLTFVVVYFSWVMFSLLGYVIYQHHRAFGVDLLPGGEADAGRPQLTPEQRMDRALDKEVSHLVASGDITAALGAAYEAQRTEPHSLPAQRRYHRVLLLSGKTPTLLDHGRRFIEQLVRQGQVSEALRVWQACRAKDEAFAPEHSASTFALARHAWQAGDAKEALRLVNSFDRRFKGDPLIPQVYELAARALTQGLNRPRMALPILQQLEHKYPGHEATREVRWLLREVVEGGAAAVEG